MLATAASTWSLRQVMPVCPTWTLRFFTFAPNIG